jgi:hypothetical protein
MKVVYVAGSMRSGTTLVAELLGSFAGAVAVGELNNLSLAARSGQRCSCGVDPADCELWGPVFGELLSGSAALRIGDLRRTLERQRRLPEFARLARLPEARWPSDVAEYVAFLRSTVRVLLEASGARTLIDSSKSAPGLALMRLAHPGQVSVLHLLRDPRGVAYSESHHVHQRDESTAAPPGVRPILRSAKDWDTANLECYLLSRSVRLRSTAWYEALCAAPREQIERVAREVGLDGEGPTFEGSRVRPATSHVLAGNPSRTGPEWRTVQSDDKWRRGLSTQEKLLVSFVVWPLEAALRWRGDLSESRAG